MTAQTAISAACPSPLAGRSVDWDAIAARLAPIRTERGAAVLRRKSRDYYWFSPILKETLGDVLADLVVVPASMAEVAAVARLCVAEKLPLTVRGGGTGNYGQAMPLAGGVVLDMSRLTGILSADEASVRAEAGAKLADLEKAVLPLGRELRFHPSTWRSATVGGFVAGGSSGCGAINYGTLHTPGNVLALRALTLGAEPAIVELQGEAAQALVHAYGTNAVILEVELALAPARRWHERILAVPGLAEGLDLIGAIAGDDTLAKKELALCDAAVVALLEPLGGLVAPGEVAILAMVAEESLPALAALAEAHGARTAFARTPDEKPGKVPALYELAWNHTTLHALASDPSISYMQIALPADYRAAVLALAAALGDEVPIHLEMARIDGAVVCLGLPLLRYTDAARLAEIHALCRAHGCTVFNPHTHILETGGLQVADPAQLAFRKTGDPFGLLNPGKMPGWDVEVHDMAP